MKSMKISTRRILPLLFLPLLMASCSKTPQPISYGEDICSLCHNTIMNDAFAAQAMSHDGTQHNYDSIECLVEHLGQQESEMAVVKVADFLHPGNMLNAQQSHFKFTLDSTQGSHLSALRHDRANTLCWKELTKQRLQRSEYVTQNEVPADLSVQSYQ